MTDQQLRSTLQHIADGATVVDLGPRVRDRTRVLRRRRRAASVAVPVIAVVAAAVLLASPSDPDAAPPAERTPGPVPTVDLAEAAAGGLAGAALSVVDLDTGTAWLVTGSGRAARLLVRVDSLPGALPALSAGGTVLSFGRPGTAVLVSSVDGEAVDVSVPDRQHHLAAVSPDGRTVASAVDNQVDSIELTLVPLDGTPPTTLPVTSSAASGALVPVVWSDDGSGVLVLEGAGATRVDLEPEPRARRGVFVKDDLVLAHGWAVAPDLSRFAMGGARSRNGERQWLVLDSGTGGTTDVITRPVDDRLIGWTVDDRLTWWHQTANGYTVVSTDTDGQSPRRELRLVSSLPNLSATWTEDAG